MIVAWPGKSGEKYQTVLWKLGDELPNDAGVYIFCKQAIDRSWVQIYVGETDDFDSRLNINLTSHHRWDCIVRERATHVCSLTIVGGKKVRLVTETDLRLGLDPPCNRQ
ncbi:MAG: hypothetical protein WBQ86_03080 [Candidatus Binatus sp.]